jgi:NADPH-dependent 2,4-dienoyl-CoA reductase/sulfur reductase-like enzyme
MNGVVIVGAGLAGSRCAEALRAGGCELPVTIVGAESIAPYERPALSKDFLAGKRLEVRETQCCASGSHACRFEVLF